MTPVEPSSISQIFKISDLNKKNQIRQALEAIGPTSRKDEPYCDYVFVFEDKPERLVVKQYQKGTLMIQGKAAHLYQVISHMVAPFLTENDQMALNKKADGSPQDPQSVPLPHIGTDESGKGDYFGPMVIAGVMLEEAARPKLTALGIRDSKKLADGKNRELAAKIRKLCVQRYYEVVLPPERYNSLYTDFKKEGKNLNHILAWGHARAIESLLGYADCKWAVADQFGNERYIQSRLMKKSGGLTLIQQHKGERFLAVAAASILARDRFLDYMDRLSRTYEITLPKGSSNIVVGVGKQFVAKHGAENLEKVAKLHHKTTEKIL